MTRRKVTDEIVAQFVKRTMELFASWESDCSREESLRLTRALLEAALNPAEPAEPEIEVTAGMEEAGAAAVVNVHRNTPEGEPYSRPAIRACYRAMERVRREEEAKLIHCHGRHNKDVMKSDWGVRVHRRAGDPK